MGVRFALVVAALVACSPAQAPATATVSLRMRGTPNDATVTIDDQNIGQLDYVAARGVALPQGVHHITVQAPGYFPMDREVDAKANGKGAPPIDVVVKLVPVPD
jgi:hypothetical protein